MSNNQQDLIRIRDNRDTTDTKGKREYKTLCLNRAYKDIALLPILKQLYKNHKINRYDYKTSIKKAINKKGLSEKIRKKVYYYLHTIKANKSKNTLRGLNRAEQQNKRHIIIHYHNQAYKVFILKKTYKKLIINEHLNLIYKDLLHKAISKEFNKLMLNQNKKIDKAILPI